MMSIFIVDDSTLCAFLGTACIVPSVAGARGSVANSWELSRVSTYMPRARKGPEWWDLLACRET